MYTKIAKWTACPNCNKRVYPIGIFQADSTLLFVNWRCGNCGYTWQVKSIAARGKK